MENDVPDIFKDARPKVEFGVIPPELQPRPEEANLLDDPKEKPQTEAPGQPAGPMVMKWDGKPESLAKARDEYADPNLVSCDPVGADRGNVDLFQQWVTEVPWSKSVGGRCDDLSLWVMGLGGESGEVIEPLKKHIRDGTPLNKNLLKKELGDVLIVLSAIAADQGIAMSDVMKAAKAKINDRIARGTMRGAGDLR